MARNIEIKAYATNFTQQLALGEQLADVNSELLIQTDTFFHSQSGRLKLREFPDRDAQLIYYHRADQSGPKLSDYHITNTPNAQELTYTLSQTLGQLAVVKKQRTLLLHGQTRLHFDQVEGLGCFIELEVVLKDEDSILYGQNEAERLMLALNIQPADLIEQAYVDLLLAN